ncbi:MAG: membrane protein insertase YidC [Actinobacteria bacterium]|nr:membrane protein insertase YidC [Actinomycetota bacterium]MCB9411542.1 membrane protein insertase YidC [Actinomycetota bacterium]
MFIIEWIEIPVSWILRFFHTLLSPIFGAASGITWVLSIVGLVVVIRILLIPLFVKQIKAQRNMQVLQPKMKEIQQKYAGDRERQSQEMMKLYKETGTNPLSSCLPILLQAPIFFALFRVLQYGIAQEQPVGALTQELVTQAHDASILGVPLYGTFINADETPNPIATRVLTVVLIVLMSATTFTTQRQLLLKNTASDNPMARQLKLMSYIFPLIFAVSGVAFPVGVLFYWLTTNLWTMGQQFWVIRNNPMPGTPAHTAFMARKAEKAARKAAKSGTAIATAETAAAVELAAEEDSKSTPARTQPKRQSRSKRSGGKGNTGRKK